ncbi:helix-turn-helix domain-containing protein [Tumebacillus algifaecis]|uniref:helix-turn-helix domain-containing protein n=1 Tax=Tumebacillus algifaecis TaxID=1214604 RepID=UPI001560D035|nr:tetratricopeptide repeat protein [Tumebacillus algifaecis]
MDTSLSLGQRIRELRFSKGMTQIELAKGLCTPSMVSQVESDRARPSYKVLVSIAARLDVPLEHLLNGVSFDLENSSKYKLAKSMVQAKEYKTAIPLLDDLLDCMAYRIPKESLLLELVLCHLELRNIVEAESKLNQLYQLANNSQNDRLLAVVLLQLGKLAALKCDYPIALFHTNRAWEELQTIEEIDTDLQAKVTMQLASLHERVGKVAEAGKFYERALLLHQHNAEERGKTYLRLAEVYDRQKKYEQAQEYAMKATVLLEEQSTNEHRQEMQRRLFMLQRDSSDWNKSVPILLSIAEQYEQNGKKQKAGEVYADLALSCLENDEYDEAWAFAEKARMALPDTDSTMGKVHRVLSFVYSRREDEKKGKRHLENAVKIFEQHGKIAELEAVTLHMCRYLSDKGEHREAFERMEAFHYYLIKQLEQRGIVL